MIFFLENEGIQKLLIRFFIQPTTGHITSVGMGTFVDPKERGGAINEKALNSKLHNKLVSRISIDGEEQLMYKALPINVAIIRGTTADAQGNISVEHESLLCDQRICAAAAKNSGGIVIAQVKRLAATGSLNARDVTVPGALVNCVVVVDEKDQDELHSISYVERHNPAFTGEVRTPADQITPMPLDIRKVIARRAFFALKPDKIVNLGIGLPEGVASVAAEEDLLQFITLSTEPGVFGGLPAQGHSFGPAYNAAALIEMNQMFDFYDGGGLDMCFLGAAQISKNGDINVSRMSEDRITGPGGFIDISQSTRRCTFMCPFSAKGLVVNIPGDGTLKIEKEGQVKKFVDSVYEKTFSGDEAVRRGQSVQYVTERCVFRRSADHPVLELIEIAPGVDLQKDILDHLDFEPVVSPMLKLMDARIFKDEKMNAKAEMFGNLEERCTYHEKDHTIFVDLFGVTLGSVDDVNGFMEGLKAILRPLTQKSGKIHIVLNYDGFDLQKGLEELYRAEAAKIQEEFYASVKRFAGSAFRHARLLGQDLKIENLDPNKLYDEFDINGDGSVSLEELRLSMKEQFQISLTPTELAKFHVDPKSPQSKIDRETFVKEIGAILKSSE
jgi:propionate CoA-transferase